MKLRLGILPKLTLVFVLFAALLVTSLGALVYVNARASLQVANTSALLSTALEKQTRLNAWVEERQHDVSALAETPSVIAEVENFMLADSGPQAYERLVADFLPYAQPRGEFLEVMILDPETGKVLLSTAPAQEGKFKENQPYFINGRNGAFVQNVYYSISLQAPAMAASAPIRAEAGRLLAVLAAWLDLEEMNAIMAQHTGLHRSDEAFLVNASSLFVTQPRLLTDPAVLQRGVHTEAVGRCLESSSGAISALDYRGVPALIVYRWLPERQLCLIQKMDEAEALAPATTLGRTVMAVSGGLLILASALAYWLALGFTRPIRLLKEGAARFGAGDLDHRLDVSGADEIGELARSMQSMAANLKRSRSELEETIRELDAFAYSVSHDLRAPLRAIDGFSQALLKRHTGNLNDSARHYLQRILQNTQNMGQLIDELLQLSRLNRQPLKRQTVSPLAVVSEALADLHDGQAGRNGDFIVAPDLPNCQADPFLLKQVYINLLSNAFKFTRTREKAKIEVGFQVSDFRSQLADLPAGSSQSVIYFVRDNGVGFDMQYADKLFGVFQRLHSDEEFAGTGIGLAIVQRIVHRHGGRVWAEAAVNEGATFFFTLNGVIEHEPPK